MKVLFYALLAGIASSYVVVPKTSVRRTTQLHESFGFDFAENSYDNQIEQLKGEANYKQWVNRISDDNMLNRQVRYIDSTALISPLIPQCLTLCFVLAVQCRPSCA
jgi:hypothetical protein